MVYIDDAGIPKHGRLWFHMVADSIDELHAFAAKLDLPDRAFHRGARHPHYDIPEDVCPRALALGARSITSRDAVRILRKWRTA